VVVLRYDYWLSRFVADPNVIGKKILVNNYPMRSSSVGAGVRRVDPTRSPQIRGTDS